MCTSKGYQGRLKCAFHSSTYTECIGRSLGTPASKFEPAEAGGERAVNCFLMYIYKCIEMIEANQRRWQSNSELSTDMYRKHHVNPTTGDYSRKYQG